MNAILKIKELINKLEEANLAYYRDDNPIMTDYEYDGLMDELVELEKQTGIIFANSPTHRIGGGNKAGLKKVKHSKRMLSAQKTKSLEEFYGFAIKNLVLLSWKLDGLSLILRYKEGKFVQAITRGEEGLEGEDVTLAVKYLRGVPKQIKTSLSFEVRGEGVLSWADYNFINRKGDAGHPRNAAAGMVRARQPMAETLARMDFIAFELICTTKEFDDEKYATKQQHFRFLTDMGFHTVPYVCLGNSECDRNDFDEVVAKFAPEEYSYPVDGIIAEYDDIKYGNSLGATEHHANKMLALKWEDKLYETTFQRIEFSTTKTGLVTMTAVFDPVEIDGSIVTRAGLHSLDYVEKMKFGVGDKLRIYLANMIIPQILENSTKSGAYELPKLCSCCGSPYEIKISKNGQRNYYCPNSNCIARNAQRIARYCDKDAMNIEGMSAKNVERLMAFGFIRNYADIYRLSNHRNEILTTPGFGSEGYQKMISSIEESRHCELWQFLNGLNIPLMGMTAAQQISNYFYGDWHEFEEAIKYKFDFNRIEGVSENLSKNIYNWFSDAKEQELFRPLLSELTFKGASKKVGEEGNPFKNANVVITGSVNGLNHSEAAELLKMLGADVMDEITKKTDYLIVGAQPATSILSEALSAGVTIITEGHFAQLIKKTEV